MIALTSVLHDPEARLIDISREAIGRLRFLFGTFTVIVSEKTHPAMINMLKERSLNVKIDLGKPYLGYKAALETGVMGGADYVLLVDFDRLVVWATKHFDELEEIHKKDYYPFTIIQRSETAFRSHPNLQFETEYIANFYLSKVFGMEEVTDFFSGAWLFSKDVAWHIIENTKAEDNGFYGEWIALAMEKADDVTVLSCNGLEWETPYQYKKEIEEMGMEAWMRDFEAKDKEKRLENMYKILKEVMKKKDMAFKGINLV